MGELKIKLRKMVEEKILFFPEEYKKDFKSIEGIASNGGYRVCFYPKGTISEKVLSSVNLYEIGKMVCVGFSNDRDFYSLSREGRGFDRELLNMDIIEGDTIDLSNREGLIKKISNSL